MTAEQACSAARIADGSFSGGLDLQKVLHGCHILHGHHLKEASIFSLHLYPNSMLLWSGHFSTAVMACSLLIHILKDDGSNETSACKRCANVIVGGRGQRSLPDNGCKLVVPNKFVLHLSFDGHAAKAA